MTTTIKIAATLTILTYLIVASIGCSPMGVITCDVLDNIGIESQIGLADVDGKESYGHLYVIVNDQPYEPRYLGLYLQGNIDYDNPYEVYNSGDDYVTAGYTILPSVNTIVSAIIEA
jgi:hypothetical protein